MQTWVEFFEKVLGPSWSTSLLGIGLMFLSFPVFTLGGILLYFQQKELGAVAMTQGGTLLVTGVGFLIARSNDASEKRAGQLAGDIQTTKKAVVEVRDDAIPAAKQAAQETVKEELRK